jgi:hypothetical protein
MFFSQDRNQLRQMYLDAWRKHQQKLPMEPLESVIANIVARHPEYHATLEQGDDILDKDYSPESGESNPFLHMGMHIAIHEQLATDRPRGIKDAYQQLLNKVADPHQVEHQMMECLAEMIWSAQRNNTAPDETEYLQCLYSRI